MIFGLFFLAGKAKIVSGVLWPHLIFMHTSFLRHQSRKQINSIWRLPGVQKRESSEKTRKATSSALNSFRLCILYLSFRLAGLIMDIIHLALLKFKSHKLIVTHECGLMTIAYSFKRNTNSKNNLFDASCCNIMQVYARERELGNKVNSCCGRSN